MSINVGLYKFAKFIRWLAFLFILFYAGLIAMDEIVFLKTLMPSFVAVVLVTLVAEIIKPVALVVTVSKTGEEVVFKMLKSQMRIFKREESQFTIDMDDFDFKIKKNSHFIDLEIYKVNHGEDFSERLRLNVRPAGKRQADKLLRYLTQLKQS